MEKLLIKKKLFEYQNQNLMLQFVTRLGFKNISLAQQKFIELKKLIYIIFLVQCHQAETEDFDLIPAMRELDEMWHIFILMTNDYANFCSAVFGTFVHHAPKINSEAKFPHRPGEQLKKLAHIRPQVELVMKTWGPETVGNWYLPPKIQKKDSRWIQLSLMK